jgi:hypothetical protein
MNAVDTFQKRLRDDIGAVEKEIQSHNQQAQALTQRLESLKRAEELFHSDHAAIAELLDAILDNGSGTARNRASGPAAAAQRVAASPKGPRKHNERRARTKRSNVNTARANQARRTLGQTDGLTGVNMMAAVLRRHPRRTVRELIALLDREFRWKANESAVTGKLYTRRDMFVHTPSDRSSNRPVTWSLK